MHQQGQLLALISPLLYVPIIVHFRDELLSHLLTGANKHEVQQTQKQVWKVLFIQQLIVIAK